MATLTPTPTFTLAPTPTSAPTPISTNRPNPYSHGVLGYWAVVGHGFNIASIVSSGFVVAAVVLSCLRKPQLLSRTSFRLSAWIAVCDIIYSACGLCTFDNGYMSGLSEMHLRVIHWFMSGSILSFVFLTVCLGIHLILTVLTHKSNIARPIQAFYEYVSVFLGFLLAHPILYLYTLVQWAPRAQVFHIQADPAEYNRNAWLTKWMWILGSIVFLLGVSVAVCNKMIRSFSKTSSLTAYPEGTSEWDDITISSVNAQRKREIRSVTLRIACYPLVPIFTQTWVLAANTVNLCPMWLYVLANLLPATQGMINFLIFLMNPAWDGQRSKIFKRALPPRAKEEKSMLVNDARFDFTKLNASTVNLSPYQSREDV
ncbi:hypothetical protein GQ54DRAFT_264521 [Martensiomyces pterosporus]|nr:hypothetical protein GQ54DRAFT_264521 [Martensiomyces pterosporus]